jgi:hypothetical protein
LSSEKFFKDFSERRKNTYPSIKNTNVLQLGI